MPRARLWVATGPPTLEEGTGVNTRPSLQGPRRRAGKTVEMREGGGHDWAPEESVGNTASWVEGRRNSPETGPWRENAAAEIEEFTEVRGRLGGSVG